MLKKMIKITESSLSAASVDKARRLAKEEKVSLVKDNATSFKFKVEGDNGTYNVNIIVNGNKSNATCSCPSNKVCSHILAGLYLLQELQGGFCSSQQKEKDDEVADNIRDFIQPYSHDTVEIPIIADLMGIELEYEGNTNLIWKLFNQEFKALMDKGFKLKYDSSVDFELISPIVSKENLLEIFQEYYFFFWAWSNMSKSREVGIHVHLSMDKYFASGKVPKQETFNFLKELLILFEERILDEKVQNLLFGRKFNRFAGSFKRAGNMRYKWINLTTLNRRVGKTIEIRLPSVRKAGELPQVIEVSELLKTYIANSLLLWRKQGRKTFEEFYNENKPLLTKVYSKKELKEFLKTFKPDTLRKTK